MLSTMMDIQLTITSLMRYGTTVYGGQGGRHLRPGTAPRRQSYAADRPPRGPAGQRAALARRGRRPAGRHADVEQRRAPRGIPGHPVDGRGAAHAQPAARPARPDRLHRHPCRGRRRSSSTATLVPLLAQVLPHAAAIRHVHRHRPGEAETRSSPPLAGPGTRGALLRGRCSPRQPDIVRLARAGRAVGRGDVLHQRHHRPPQGRGLQPPLVVPALDGRLHGQQLRRVRARPGPAGRAACSTPTPGACPTPRCWPAPT